MTRLYFHASNSGVGGTLPTAEQSTLTSTIDFETQTINRSMNTTIGTGQTSLSRVGTMATSSRNYYVSRFVSPPLYQTSISANTWVYAFTASESVTGCNFPGAGNNNAVHVNCYVWRPSDGTKVGTILDGNTAATVDEGSANEQQWHIVNFTGSAVSNMQDGDVIIFEVWFVITSGVATSQTIAFYLDGTDDTYAENATSTDAASYLETPEDLVLTLFVSQTSIHKYHIMNDVVETSIQKYHLLQNVEATTSIHKYNLFNTVAASTSIHKYNLLHNVLQTSIHKYNLTAFILSDSIHKYSLLQSIAQSSVHKYNLLQEIIQTSIHKYNIVAVGQVTATTIHKYNLSQYVAQTSTQKYDLLNTLIQTSVHKYNTLQDILQTSTHSYNLLNTLLQTSVHKYHILQNILQESIQKYNIIAPVLVLVNNIHKYDIRQLVTQQSIHKYKILKLAVPTPLLPFVDFGATPARTTKGITLRCFTPETRVTEQGMGGMVDEFEERVIIQAAVRDAKGEGERLGREPGTLIAIEKYLVELIKTNRDALHDEGVQYMDVVSAETFPTIAGGEENQQVWYILNLTVKLCYWMRITEPM